MDDSRILQTLRATAWERAKGELRAMLQTFYTEYTNDGRAMPSKFGELDKCIKEFIEEIEDEIGI